MNRGSCERFWSAWSSQKSFFRQLDVVDPQLTATSKMAFNTCLEASVNVFGVREVLRNHFGWFEAEEDAVFPQFLDLRNEGKQVPAIWFGAAMKDWNPNLLQKCPES